MSTRSERMSLAVVSLLVVGPFAALADGKPLGGGGMPSDAGVAALEVATASSDFTIDTGIEIIIAGLAPTACACNDSFIAYYEADSQRIVRQAYPDTGEPEVLLTLPGRCEVTDLEMGADDMIYAGYYCIRGSEGVFRLDPASGGVTPVFQGAAPGGLGVLDQVLWAHGEGSELVRRNADGTGPATRVHSLPPGWHASDVAGHPSAETIIFTMQPYPFDDGYVVRRPAGGPNQVVFHGFSPSQVAWDTVNNVVVWTDSLIDSVLMRKADGTGPVTVLAGPRNATTFGPPTIAVPYGVRLDVAVRGTPGETLVIISAAYINVPSAPGGGVFAVPVMHGGGE